MNCNLTTSNYRLERDRGINPLRQRSSTSIQGRVDQVASVADGREALGDCWHSLSRQWDATCELWQDPVRRAFEREYWEPLGQDLQATLREAESLAELIAQAQRHVR
jgi:hypothetical protein